MTDGMRPGTHLAQGEGQPRHAKSMGDKESMAFRGCTRDYGYTAEPFRDIVGFNEGNNPPARRMTPMIYLASFLLVHDDSDLQFTSETEEFRKV